MRYTGSVTNAFVQSMASNFEDALGRMEAALTDCPDGLWETDLWPDEAPTGPGPHGGLHGSSPWFLAYHALTCLDYDLAGEFEPWHRRNPSTRTPGPFRTACSPGPNSSVTSTTAAGGCAGRSTRSPKTPRRGRSRRPSLPRHAVRSARRQHPAARRRARLPDPPVPHRRRSQAATALITSATQRDGFAVLGCEIRHTPALWRRRTLRMTNGPRQRRPVTCSTQSRNSVKRS